MHANEMQTLRWTWICVNGGEKINECDTSTINFYSKMENILAQNSWNKASVCYNVFKSCLVSRKKTNCLGEQKKSFNSDSI